MIVTSKLVEWAAIGVTVLGGGIWVGSIEKDVENVNTKVELNVEATSKINDMAVDMATLLANVGFINQQMGDLKEQQKEILDELRKK